MNLRIKLLVEETPHTGPAWGAVLMSLTVLRATGNSATDNSAMDNSAMDNSAMDNSATGAVGRPEIAILRLPATTFWSHSKCFSFIIQNI